MCLFVGLHYKGKGPSQLRKSEKWPFLLYTQYFIASLCRVSKEKRVSTKVSCQPRYSCSMGATAERMREQFVSRHDKPLCSLRVSHPHYVFSPYYSVYATLTPMLHRNPHPMSHRRKRGLRLIHSSQSFHIHARVNAQLCLQRPNNAPHTRALVF